MKPAKSARPAAEADKRPAKLTGRVGRITVSTSAEGRLVDVEIVTKTGEVRCAALDASDAPRFSALLAVAGLALTSGSKLHLQTAEGADGKLLIASAEIRGKR